MANPSWSYTCPYEALGVPPGADEASIRKAYRQKAKQYHPDVNKGEQAEAEAKFITIGQAYEFLVNRNRGGKNDGTMASGNSAAFHDWYWQFRMSRTWDKQQQKRDPKAAPGFASQPQSKEELRGQLAGLRQRAAVRRQRSRPSASSASSSTAEAATEGSATSSFDGFDVTGSATSSYDGGSWHASMDDFDAGAFSYSESHATSGGQQQSQEQQTEHTVFHAVYDGPSDSGDPTPPEPQQGGARRPRFSAGEQERSQLRAQLGGLKRRAAMKQQDSQ